jgi:hypothetical protein
MFCHGSAQEPPPPPPPPPPPGLLSMKNVFMLFSAILFGIYIIYRGLEKKNPI